MVMNRRGLLTGFASLLAAPSIVRAQSLMQITGERYHIWEKTLPILPPFPFLETDVTPWDSYVGPSGRLFEGRWTFFGNTHSIYYDRVIAFSKAEYPPSNQQR